VNRVRAWLIGALVFAGIVLCLRWWGPGREHSQDRPILAAARHYGVDPALVKAVVWRESWFHPRARGRKGEIGLMQIRRGTALAWAKAERMRRFRLDWLFDPAINTLAGAWYLKTLLRRYAGTDQPLPYVLADYNAGRSNVLRWLKGAALTNSAAFVQQIDFPGTRRYLQAVLLRRARYQRERFGAE
jgi:peptidoglycan lytic transglycosylase